MKRKRRSIRLPGYDYSRPGAYFVTICTQNRECLFGQITNGQMILNHAGQGVGKWFHELENKFPDIRCDEYIIMPNHVHFIVINVGADLRVCPDNGQSHRIAPTNPWNCIMTDKSSGEHTGSPLHVVVQWFKTMTTNEYIRGVKQYGWPRFDGKLWPRNYYEHIIRNDNDLSHIREYIVNNPSTWEGDRENPHPLEQAIGGTTA
jgi:REP element-mobilizing transposase RayT